MKEKFNPKPWARNRHIQSIFASLKIRAMGSNAMVECAKKMIVDGGNGIRLLGFHSAHGDNSGKGLILLIHGWEGSSDSTYILHTGNYLFKKGYDIFRLNLRDHGASHHLNEGLFHGGRTDETFTAASNIAKLSRGKPFSIVGFSLGGNFALRIALRHGKMPVKDLKQIISISAILDPLRSTLLIDNSLFIYRHYFLKKWKRSLEIKQGLFPDMYDFTDILKMKTLMEMTDGVTDGYSHFQDHREYFNTYTLLGNALADLSVPVSMIISRDDPFILVKDFFELKRNHNLHLSVQQHGGHCGFLDPFPFGCWFEREIDRIMKKYTI